MRNVGMRLLTIGDEDGKGMGKGEEEGAIGTHLGHVTGVIGCFGELASFCKSLHSAYSAQYHLLALGTPDSVGCSVIRCMRLVPTVWGWWNNSRGSTSY